jgi:DNA-binding SARP family transcriptional activator/tetratricopeptide (TPR) repeat protein
VASGIVLRLLGPVEVLVNDTWSTPRKPQQRLVMAMLALRPGQVVPVDELIDAVWEEDPPRSARGSLQVLMTRLRQTLARVPGGRLERYGDGYRLQMEPGRMDVHVFRSLTKAGRAAADGRAAVAAFDQALALWRGPAMADVRGTPRVEAIRSTLAEERLGAASDRIGGLLNCGLEREAAAELPALLARNPLAERLAGMLMVALYRCGQRSDALQVFRDVRGRLRRELGVEPGPELQGLHRQILAGAADLAAPVGDGCPPDPFPAPVLRGAVLPGTVLPRAVHPDAGQPGLGLRGTARPAAGRPSAGYLAAGPPAGAYQTAAPAAVTGNGYQAAAPAVVTGHGYQAAAPAAVTGNGYQAAAPAVVTGHGYQAAAPAVVTGDEYQAAAPAVVTGNGYAGVPPVPRLLPAAPAHFAGRARELRTLDELLSQAMGADGRGVIWVVDGTAGVGKTALAVYWAHQVADQFPDGQLYVNLRGFGPSDCPVTPGEAIRGLLSTLQVPSAKIPETLDAQAGLYRSTLAGKRMLILLDNARDEGQVRPLLPGGTACPVLITSRSRLTGLVAAEGAHPLSLDVLSEEDSCELLTRQLGARRVIAEPAAARALAGLCAGLPLALAVAAARAAARPALPLAALTAELHGTRGRLDALETGDAASSVREVLSWSCRQLNSTASRMFRLLGVHPGPDISVPAAASLLGAGLAEARDALAELKRAHLLTEPAPGRFSCHDVLRAYAAEQARARDGAAEGSAAIHRALDHYLHTAHAAALLLYPRREVLPLPALQPGAIREALTTRAQAQAWFEAEREVLLAVTGRAAEAGFDRHAWQIPWTMRNFLDREGHWHDWARTQRAALAAAGRLGDRAGQAHAHRNIGRACLRLGRYDDARGHLRDGLALYRQLGHYYGQARTHFEIAWGAERQGRYREALAHSRQALEAFRAAGDRQGAAIALNAQGWCLTQLGSHQQALTCSRQALAVLQETGHDGGEAAAWMTVGFASHHLGRDLETLACYQRALALHRALGDRYHQSRTLVYLGETHRALGSPAAARQAWRQALAILEELHHPEAAQVRSLLDGLPAPWSEIPRRRQVAHAGS